ncbi:MAG TPA: hypothetical protein VIK97_17835, partial [Casimicrobiaceae bacterium]
GAAQEFKTSVESAAQDVHAGVRSVEEQLNAGATDAAPPDAQASPAVAPAEPALGVAAEPPRQPSLPGFDKI